LSCTFQRRSRFRTKIRAGNSKGRIRELGSVISDVCRESCCCRRTSGNQGPSRATRVCRRESQLRTLLDPAQGKVLTQFVKVQVVRLPTGEDRFDDIRRQEGRAENLTDVTLRQSGVAGQRSHVECFSMNHLLIPAVSSG